MNTPEKLSALRKLMQERGMAAYLVVTDDFHCSEYVGDYFKARAWLSGFTGSAGTLVVTMDSAALWTDGRYFLQARAQLEGSTIDLMKVGQPGVPYIEQYLAGRLQPGDVLGFDGRTVRVSFLRSLERSLKDKGVAFVTDQDLVDEIWTDRPAMSKRPVWELVPEFAGQTREEKLERLRKVMEEQQAQWLVLTALDQIAWTLDLRGDDVACTPVFLSYLLIGREKATLCVHKEILSGAITDELAACGVELADYDGIYGLLAALPQGDTVMVDPAGANCRILGSISAHVLEQPSPVLLMKAVKTPQEMEHVRQAHIRDGAAVCRFIRWLQESVARGNQVTELSASAKLEQFRSEAGGFLEPSFDTIMAYGPHAAIVHYSPTAESDVPMQARGLCLCDSGGQYRDGTTDITRTIPLGPLTQEEKTSYTLVLQGHLHLGAARFLYGTCGANLDYLARGPLWQRGLDYNHGTGHGVGYVLCVHEGPQSMGWKLDGKFVPQVLEEGMIISNEPGFYQAGQYGIRHEDLMLVRKGEATEFGQFLYFQTLTMVPFDTAGLDLSLMSDEEIGLLNAYHRTVYETVSPLLSGEDLAWLEKAVEPVLPLDEAGDPDRKAAGKDTPERQSMQKALDQLPVQERTVLRLRYWQEMPQSRCARLLGMSRPQLSRLERQATEALRRKLEQEKG